MKSCFVFIGLVLLSFSAQAKVWTVDNRPGANFTTLSAAHSGASSGDTILIAGSGTPYAGITFTKKLFIFGPGFFLGQNTGLQADTNAASVGQCTFNAGSQGTVVMGIRFTGTLYINTDKISVKRCFVEENSQAAIYIYSNKDSITISQNYLFQNNSSSGNPTINVGSDGVNGATRIYIKNNFIDKAGTTYSALYIPYSTTGEVFNNVIRQHVTIHSIQFNNNILYQGTFTVTGSTPYNCISNSTQFNSYTGTPYFCKINQSMSSVFTLTGSADARWQIQPAGPADNAGFGGADCGMFDTSENNAYVLSGVPPIPSIYEITANSDLSNVTVKAKSNN
ncbi:hypothetical protein K1X84_10125 [bacterium]|nr:hypothetical protein [bacterium]